MKVKPICTIAALLLFAFSEATLLIAKSESLPSVATQSSRVGPANIYPRENLNPGLANPDISQANIADNICNKKWSTGSIRPPSSYTTSLKVTQITKYGFTDTKKGDYEEDH